MPPVIVMLAFEPNDNIPDAADTALPDNVTPLATRLPVVLTVPATFAPVPVTKNTLAVPATLVATSEFA